MAKWLMITEGEDLRNTILEEYKRHPQVFDLISDFQECDPTEYDKIIIGADIWERYRTGEVGSEFRKSFRDFKFELMERSFRSRSNYHVIRQCSGCGRIGIRLNIGYKGLCKDCRSGLRENPNAVIRNDHDNEWIETIIKSEPSHVKIVSKDIPEILGELTENVIETYFPEFNGIEIGLTRTQLGQSIFPWRIALNPELVTNYSRMGTIHTIAHELTHQSCTLQAVLRGRSERVKYLYSQNIPSGELSTEIWTFARHPDLVAPGYFMRKLKHTDNNMLELLYERYRTGVGSYSEYFSRYKELQEGHFQRHKELIHKVAIESLKMRKSGERYYIKWIKEQLSNIGIYSRQSF